MSQSQQQVKNLTGVHGRQGISDLIGHRQIINASASTGQTGFDIMRLYYPPVEDLNEDFICCVCKKIVNNPLQCANKQCTALICRACIDNHEKATGLRACKTCNKLYVDQMASAFETPSKLVLKILQGYQIICQNCERPQPMSDIVVHETLHCQNKLCANELCGQALEMLPSDSLIRFKVSGGITEVIECEKIACSKKCKKVAKFGFILKYGTENEALKAFESMMRKKMNKRAQNQGAVTLAPRGQGNQFSKLTVQTTGINNRLTQRQTINHQRNNNINGGGLESRHKRSISSKSREPNQRSMTLTARNQIPMPLIDPYFNQGEDEEFKGEDFDEETHNLQQALLMSCLLNSVDTFHDFAWDPEHSSKEMHFSKDCRHAFLSESNYYFRTVISNRPFSDGVHYWEIVADSRTEHELKVGVTTQQQFNVNSSFSDYEFGFAYYGLGQLRHNSNSVGIPFGKQFKKKGILGVCLNMNLGTLSFALDGEYMGVAFEDPQLRKGPIYAAISLLHIAGCTLVACVEKPSYFP